MARALRTAAAAEPCYADAPTRAQRQALRALLQAVRDLAIGISSPELLAACAMAEAALEGGGDIDSPIAATLLARRTAHEAARDEAVRTVALLRPSELDILRLITKGMTYTEAAEQLGITAKGARKRGAEGIHRMGARSQVDAAVILVTGGFA